MAAVRVAAMPFSASAMRTASFASTSLRLASAAADALVRVSLAASAPERAPRSAPSHARQSPHRIPLEPLRLLQIVVDVAAAVFQDGADARQRYPRHHDIERDEGQREPQILRSEAVRVERRKPAPMLAGWNMLRELMVCAAALAIVELERKEQQQRDQEGEDPERLGHGKAEDEIGELTLRSRGIADRGGR